MNYEKNMVRLQTEVVVFHYNSLTENRKALDAELVRNSPDADKILDYREEIWYHEQELRQHIDLLIGIHVYDMIEL